MPLRGYLYLAVFSSGMTTLAIELTASRLLGNIFGTSNLIWANVIGLMLLYLTAGYFIGGRLADRSPTPVRLYQIMAWGAFFSGIVPIVARPLLSAAGAAVVGFQVGVALPSFVVVLVLFALPVTLLGCVSPFAIRLAVTDLAEAGKVSGRIYAISTLGSLIGTFLPVLWLIPEAGTTRTFLYFSLYLLLVALGGLLLSGAVGRRAALWLAWQPPLLILLTALTLSSGLRPPPEARRLLYEHDSAYNYIQVTELTAPIGRLVNGVWAPLWAVGTRELYLNEGQGVHSIYTPGGGFYGGTWDMFLAAPFFNAPPYTPDDMHRLAVIGAAAGTISTQYTAVFGEDVTITGFEIDPTIIEVGRRYFGMTQPNVTVIAEDGRVGLRGTAGKFDVIAMDAYRVPYVPWHLTTVEFFQEVSDKLSNRGAAVINVGRAGADRRLVEAITATLLIVFPTVHTIDVPDSFNTILVATRVETTPANLAANRAILPTGSDPLLRQALETAAANVAPTVRGDLIFTDDRAPVETLINAMVIEYLVGRR
ncbi:MAG TPA: fused MFS/spermidine synthase [Aggregatilineales bacterium]|nr:fused MFS/spermidine synthase [Anaerolineales bacterium]HRE48116.1 fused MFS/spermidine synthase [Aggregatilineales bacterium]